MFEVWGCVPAGVLALTEWLLGEEDGEDKADEASSLDEEDFLFEKGDRNLWVEPVQWVKLLHKHLESLILTFKQSQTPVITDPDQLHQIQTLSAQARAWIQSSQHALLSLPALPQFACTIEHARLLLQNQRASMVLGLLDRLV